MLLWLLVFTLIRNIYWLQLLTVRGTEKERERDRMPKQPGTRSLCILS